MWSPFAVLREDDGGFVYAEQGGGTVRSADPFDLLDSALARRSHARSEIDIPFTGGAAGFLGYGLSRFTEPDARLRPRKAPEGDIWLGFYDRLIAFDHKNFDAWLVAGHRAGEDASPILDTLEGELEKARKRPPEKTPVEKPERTEAHSNFTREGYISAIERVRKYIEEGDCYQANISQRFTARSSLAPADMYLGLRSISPAPFAAYIDTGRARILSSSPERFLSLRGNLAQTRPIKGTRPRGSTSGEDERLAQELAESEKDRAENVMIVDLLRNDLSRVCLPNTVKVMKLCEVEKFPTVFHLTSTIEGRLRPGAGPVELLRNTFPGGSVTGAPKIRAMEIIDELEPDPRGAYCGAIGYIGFDGGMDTNVAIRTMTSKDGEYSFHAGGGITYLSDPQAEYQETLDKAKAMLEATGA